MIQKKCLPTFDYMCTQIILIAESLIAYLHKILSHSEMIQSHSTGSGHEEEGTSYSNSIS